MNDMHHIAAVPDTGTEHRKPRIALMGEFSAGKSTLANLMIGSDPLPMQVIATQLPPVWITYGDDDPVRVDLEGNAHPCVLEHLDACPIEDTAYIRISCQEDILQMCDLIDMPGISDPNMDSEVWQRVMPYCDGVVWCTHATQAWRQSEAAVWESLPQELHENSILLLTRSDMLITERDRARVLKRVIQETDGLFAQCLMISLLQARDAEYDPELWASCGAEPFVTEFLSVLQRLSEKLGTDQQNNPFAQIFEQTQETPEPPLAVAPVTPKVVPRRPKPISGTKRRLSADEASALAAKL